MLELDRQRVDQLLPLLGKARLLALAGELAAGLAVLPDLPSAPQREQLHRLAGGAASLGFGALAAALLRAEAGQGGVADLAGEAVAVVPALAAALHGKRVQR